MTMLRNPRTAGIVAALIAATMISASALGQRNAVNLALASKRTMFVFPFDTPDALPDKRETSSLLTDIARGRLIASDAYTVILFHKTLAPVARLHNDQQLTDTDV